MDYRNYDNAQERVVQTYRTMHENQTVDYVVSMKEKYKNFPGLTMTVWEMIDMLDSIVDSSDPDNDMPQSVHALQTAESLVTRYLSADRKTMKQNIEIRSLFTEAEWDNLPNFARDCYEEMVHLNQLYPTCVEWDWLLLIGLVHDLGKILIMSEFGGLEQWSVVGDTFPVGCQFSDINVYSENKFRDNCSDAQVPQYSSKNGVYEENTGLDNLLISWGHDEYMASILERNNCTVPEEAVYLIRFHSFYPWHTPRNSTGKRGYQHLASMKDWHMLPLLKAFQKSDLYSKTTNVPQMEDYREYYDDLIKKYFNNGVFNL